MNTVQAQSTVAAKGKNWGIGWMLALVGFPLGGLLVTIVNGRLESVPQALLGGVAAGLVIGVAQWLALRRRLCVPPTWIAVTAVGLGFGVGLSLTLVGAETTPTAILMRAPIAGLLLGAAQWTVLRRLVPNALIWPVVVAVAFTVAWYITSGVIGENRNLGFVIFGSSGALAYQALTGLVLWRLLRRA